jgi:hypothetical protein
MITMDVFVNNRNMLSQYVSDPEVLLARFPALMLGLAGRPQ